MNKLPKAHKKANKARCDKRRNRQRKLLKAKNKVGDGLFEQTVLVWQISHAIFESSYVGMADKTRYETLVAAKISETHKQ